MEIARLGEKALIRRLAEAVERALPGQPGVLVGIGDDAALVQNLGSYALLKTDHLVEGVHFQRQWAPPSDLGWKALAVNLSDIAAMGGLPAAALVSLALPPETDITWVDALYGGLAEAARQYGVAIVGGDTSTAPLIVISVFLTGSPPLDKAGNPRPLLRSAGRAGDAVAVTGSLGAAAAGLRLLQGQDASPREGGGDPSASWGQALRRAHLRPQPRVAEGRMLASAGVRAAMDVSDGLVSDLESLCLASGLAAQVRASAVPVDPEAARCYPQDALEMALTGGEDYELLFAAPAEVVSRVQSQAAVPITVIGTLVEGPAGRVEVRDEGGRELVLVQTGWRHF